MHYYNMALGNALRLSFQQFQDLEPSLKAERREQGRIFSFCISGRENVSLAANPSADLSSAIAAREAGTYKF